MMNLNELNTPMTESSYWNTVDRPTGWIEFINKWGIPLHMIRLGKGYITGSDRTRGLDNNADWAGNAVRGYTDASIMYYWRLDDIGMLTPTQQADLVATYLFARPWTYRPLVIDVEEPLNEFPEYLLEFIDALMTFGVRHLALYCRTNILNNFTMNFNWLPLGLANYLKDPSVLGVVENPWTWDEFAKEYIPHDLVLPVSHNKVAWWQFAGTGNKMGLKMGFSSDDVPVNLVADWFLNA